MTNQTAQSPLIQKMNFWIKVDSLLQDLGEAPRQLGEGKHVVVGETWPVDAAREIIKAREETAK